VFSFVGVLLFGRVLSDLCHDMTVGERVDGSGIRYEFGMEVFG
jgi:hypothetical protein